MMIRAAREMRVGYVPGNHDYFRSLYGAMSNADSDESRAIISFPCKERVSSRALLASFREVDLIHIGWPEHLIADDAPGSRAHLRGTAVLLDALERSGVLVSWTMHNRFPHFWPRATGVALYKGMATLAHAVIHHSLWGSGEMQTLLQYRPDAIHTVIPHGHYGDALAIDEDRAACERQLGLTPSGLRFGVIGRPQPEKRVTAIARAFLDGARPEYRLLVTAVSPNHHLPSDPRISVRPRSRWITRREIAMQVKCCDCLVAWHDGSAYLTSGLPADAIGAGIPMLVNSDWPFWHEVLGEAAITWNGDGLADAFARITDEDIARSALAAKKLRAKYDWRQLATKTARLFLQTRAPNS
jgi:glycosyltransferase involved in cell wall biosynthesis